MHVRFSSRSLSIALLAGAIALGLAACDRGADPASTADTAQSTAKALALTVSGPVSASLKGASGVHLILESEARDAADSRPPSPLATGTIENGTFSVSATVATIEPAFLSFVGKESVDLDFIAEPGASYRLEELDGSQVIRGGTINELVMGYKWMPAYIQASRRQAQLFAEIWGEVDESDEKQVTEARRKMDVPLMEMLRIREDYQHQVLSGDAPPEAKLLILMDVSDMAQRYSPEKREAMFREYAQALGEEHPLVVAYRKMEQVMAEGEAAAATVGEGMPFKEVIARDEHGNIVKLSDVIARNKLTMLDFWASWCGPCRGEFPHLEKVYKEFHEHGFEIYALSLDQDRGNWEKALREERAKGEVPWLQLVDTGGWDATSAKDYGVLGLPDNFLIAQDGTIVGRQMREWDVERVVRKKMRK